MEEYDADKINLIILPDKNDRKIVHNYLDQHYPNIKKTSIHLEKVGTRTDTYSQCHACNYKYVLLNEYHYGHMSNNYDEWKSGFCPKCDNMIIWECNSDTLSGFSKYANNAIVFGSYFREYSSKKHQKQPCSIDQYQTIIKHNQIIHIDPPGRSLNKTKLSQYINDHL